MRVMEVLRDGLAVAPLAVRVARLGGAPKPEELVDIAMGHGVIRPIQVPSELLELARLVTREAPATVLEIGTFRGGTLFVFARLAASDATIISLDLPASLMGKVYRVVQRPLFRHLVRRGQRLHLLRIDSQRRETVERVAEILGGRRLDFLFIDGDHRYDGVKADYDLHSPLVRPGGMIAFHDIRMERPSGVADFWNSVKSNHRHVEIVHEHGPRAMGIGVLWV